MKKSFMRLCNFAQVRKGSLDEAFAKAMSDMRETLYQIVEGIAEEKGYTLIISKQNVLVAAESIDITGDVMQSLNQRMPNVTLDVKAE